MLMFVNKTTSLWSGGKARQLGNRQIKRNKTFSTQAREARQGWMFIWLCSFSDF